MVVLWFIIIFVWFEDGIKVLLGDIYGLLLFFYGKWFEDDNSSHPLCFLWFEDENSSLLLCFLLFEDHFPYVFMASFNFVFFFYRKVHPGMKNHHFPYVFIYYLFFIFFYFFVFFEKCFGGSIWWSVGVVFHGWGWVGV
jgi:hypothetical protein